MCNLGQGIEERATENVTVNIILNMYKNNFTIEQIALATQYNVDKVKEIIAKQKSK